MSDTRDDAPVKAAKRPQGLGRGLSALLGDTVREEPVGAGAGTGGTPAASRNSGVQLLDIASIAPHPGQPRRHFDEAALAELADSIAQRGVIQPIIVRPQGGAYQIVAGERRWRAAQRAHLHQIPAIVREFTEAETREIALIENIQRQDLNAIEEAVAYSRLIADYGHSQEALGKIVGKSRSHVANLMRLLDLPESVQHAVVEGRIGMGHARALVGAQDAEGLARQIEVKGLSVRDAEKLANRAKGLVATPSRARGPAHKAAMTGGHRDPDIAALETHLSDILGVRVDIAYRADGAGTLTLGYTTLDQLDMLCQRLSGEPI